jgi:hypothetical protein
MNLLLITPFHNIITTKSVPLNSKPSKSVIPAAIQLVVPYTRLFKKPHNYLEYKKDSDSYVHVQVFKVTIKVNGETIDDEVTNLFNFTLKDSTFNSCNNYMQDNLNYRFANLEQAFYRCY